GLQRWKGMVETHRVAVAQLMVLQGQQTRLEGGNGEDAVGQYGHQHMHQQRRVPGDGRRALIGSSQASSLAISATGNITSNRLVTGARRLNTRVTAMTSQAINEETWKKPKDRP